MPEDRRYTSSIRRLAAILFTDIVGYTALMGKDEDREFDMLRRNHTIHRHLIKKQFRFYESISYFYLYWVPEYADDKQSAD